MGFCAFEREFGNKMAWRLRRMLWHLEPNNQDVWLMQTGMAESNTNVGSLEESRADLYGQEELDVLCDCLSTHYYLEFVPICKQASAYALYIQ